MQHALRIEVIHRTMHILLVEDEVHVRIALARPLTGWGHHVSDAASLTEASTLLATTHPELAIIDINLPDGTGWDVLQLVRNGHSPDIPMIVISAIAPSTARLRQYRPFGVLMKPFPIESLRQLVTRATNAVESTAKETTDA